MLNFFFSQCPTHRLLTSFNSETELGTIPPRRLFPNPPRVVKQPTPEEWKEQQQKQQQQEREQTDG